MAAEPLAELIASFQRSLRAEMRAENTLKLYTRGPRVFSVWLVDHDVEPDLDGLTRDNVVAWLADLGGQFQEATVKIRFAAMRRFCNWLVAEGELQASPMAGLSSPEPKPKPVPIVGDDVLVELLKVCSGKSFDDRRDEAILRVLLDAGVRVAELCGLKVDDVQLDREMALVTGKGNKVRPVYFSSRTIKALDRYLRERRRHRLAHLDALFITYRGAMCTDTARYRIESLARRAGVETRLYPHIFRHAWAHDFLVNGGQERDLKRLAGWSSDAMLERYGASAADMRAREATRRMRRGDRV